MPTSITRNARYLLVLVVAAIFAASAMATTPPTAVSTTAPAIAALPQTGTAATLSVTPTMSPPLTMKELYPKIVNWCIHGLGTTVQNRPTTWYATVITPLNASAGMTALVSMDEMAATTSAPFTGVTIFAANSQVNTAGSIAYMDADVTHRASTPATGLPSAAASAPSGQVTPLVRQLPEIVYLGDITASANGAAKAEPKVVYLGDITAGINNGANLN